MLRESPSGWRNNPSQMQQVRYRGAGGEIVVEYRFERAGLRLVADGHDFADASCAASGPSQVRLRIDGVERAYEIQQVDDTFYVDSSLGASTLVELPRFPLPEDQAAAGSLVAPLPGVVNEVKVKPGDSVAAGDVLLVIDSMKVFHSIAAPLAGRVAEIRVEPGSQVEAGTLLAVIEEVS